MKKEFNLLSKRNFFGYLYYIVIYELKNKNGVRAFNPYTYGDDLRLKVFLNPYL